MKDSRFYDDKYENELSLWRKNILNENFLE